MKSRHLVSHGAAQKIVAQRRVESDPTTSGKSAAHDLLVSERDNAIVQHPVIFRVKDPPRLTVHLPERLESLRECIPESRRDIAEGQESPKGDTV